MRKTCDKPIIWTRMILRCNLTEGHKGECEP